MKWETLWNVLLRDSTLQSWLFLGIFNHTVFVQRWRNRICFILFWAQWFQKQAKKKEVAALQQHTVYTEVTAVTQMSTQARAKKSCFLRMHHVHVHEYYTHCTGSITHTALVLALCVCPFTTLPESAEQNARAILMNGRRLFLFPNIQMVPRTRNLNLVTVCTYAYESR